MNDVTAGLLEEIRRAAQPMVPLVTVVDGRWVAALGEWRVVDAAGGRVGQWHTEGVRGNDRVGRGPGGAVVALAEAMRAEGYFDVCPGEARETVRAGRDVVSLIEARLSECLGHLYYQQTPDERADEATKHLNLRGFDITDAPSLTRAAVFVLAGGRPTPEERVRIATRLARYHRQLADVLGRAAA